MSLSQVDNRNDCTNRLFSRAAATARGPSRIALCWLVYVVAGCGQDSAPSPPVASDVFPSNGSGVVSVEIDPEEVVEAGAVLPPAEIDLAIASWDEIQAKIAESKGKVVVLDLWSTSCAPCIKELPNLAKLSAQYPEAVVCMSASVDYTGAEEETPESHREKVMKILAPRNMTCQNFICSTSDFDIYDKIGLASIPAVIVYDREGKLLKRFDNDKNDYGEEGFTYADHIVPLIEQTLGE